MYDPLIVEANEDAVNALKAYEAASESFKEQARRHVLYRTTW